ncbi:MAG: mobilization protein [Bacteroidetes bacterium]|nr:MAG: mobilization protein [Bacteroidota bacterium]
MYITITPQKLTGNYTQSAGDFVAYLEKENDGKAADAIEHFFNQYGEEISSNEVIQEIDNNTSKLKKTEPKFYSITVNPSKYELQQLTNHSQELKRYTREIMKDYASAFHREINGRTINVDDIKYYAKIEHERTYKGTDKMIRENAPYHGKIVRLKHEIQQIKTGEIAGSIKRKYQQIAQLKREAPHKVNGELIKQGMPKQGSQAHVHIIMSRKDISNRYSLSPGSKYKASETVFNGKQVKRGFNRELFYEKAEKTFDKTFNYDRNFVETFQARKTFIKDPEKYFASLMGLPTNQKAMAFQLLGKTGMNNTLINIPTNKVQLALKVVRRIKRTMSTAIQSSSIGI